MIDVGSRVRDYEIVARLKAGGMATLFLARRSGAAGFAKHVAIKVVHQHLAQDPEFIRMFVEEAKLSARIHHPNVVHVEELGEIDGTYFLVMEYVHGSALATLLGSLARLERKLAPELAVWIAMQVAEGLHAAHELKDEHGRPLGVVHRDVSPQNVIIAEAGHVKLIDFGIAKAEGRNKRTETGALKGKLRYMPPEQAYGRAIDRRADIYALGIVLWEMLTMQRMFRSRNDLALIDEVRAPRIEPPSRAAPEVGPALDRVVMRALSVDPAARPETAQELRRALLEACPGAAGVDAGRVGEVVAAVLGEHLEQRRRDLPESLTGVTRGQRAPTDRALHAEVLRVMTVSAPGIRYQPEGQSVEGSIELSSPTTPVFTPPPAPPLPTSTAPVAAPNRDRAVAMVAIGVAMLAVGVAVGAMVAPRGAPATSAIAATPLAPLPPPTTTGPVAAVVLDGGAPSSPDAGVVAASEPTDSEPARSRRRRRDATRRVEEPDDGIRRVTSGAPIYDDETY